jgi:hypothetical protein
MYYDAHMKYKREFGQQKSNRMWYTIIVLWGDNNGNEKNK